MIDSKVKTKSTTNTQLVVAVLAAFMAGGLAFAAAPAAQKCGVNTIKFTTVGACGKNMYTGASISCHDGTRVNYQPGACVPSLKVQQFAQAACANKCAGRPVPQPPVVVATGTLSLAMDNNILENGSDILVYPRYILNGTNQIVARVRVTAGPQEAVNLRSLAFNLVTASREHLRSHISSFGIYSSRNILDNAVPLAQMTLENMTADDLNYQIPAGTSDYIYIKANTITVDEQTASGTPFQSVGFSLSLRDPSPSLGVASANNIQPSIDYNTQSNRVDIQPIIITGVRDTSIGNEQLVGGNQTLFSFGVAATGGNNRTQFGEVMKARLTSLKLRIDTNIPTRNFSNIELCRVETGYCMPLMFSSTTPNLLTSIDPENDRRAYPNYSYVVMRDNTEFMENGSDTIDSNESGSFFVRANVIPVPDSHIQMRIAEVNNAGIAYSFEWHGDLYPDAFVRDARLSRDLNPNYPDILGNTLTN